MDGGSSGNNNGIWKSTENLDADHREGHGRPPTPFIYGRSEMPGDKISGRKNAHIAGKIYNYLRAAGLKRRASGLFAPAQQIGRTAAGATRTGAQIINHSRGNYGG